LNFANGRRPWQQFKTIAKKLLPKSFGLLEYEGFSKFGLKNFLWLGVKKSKIGYSSWLYWCKPRVWCGLFFF